MPGIFVTHKHGSQVPPCYRSHAYAFPVAIRVVHPPKRMDKSKSVRLICYVIVHWESSD